MVTAVCLPLVMTGCTRTPGDPLECFNRGVFGFNKALDRVVIKPAAHLYDALIPKPVKMGVSNVYENLRELPTFANDVLQGKFRDASNTGGRFVLNTTIGIVGIFNVASYAGLERRTNDFGLTLARWGWKDSSYLVLPILGPSTIRDGIGLGATYYMSVYPYIHSRKARYGLLALYYVELRADFLKNEPAIEEASINEYTFYKDAYLQHRQYEMGGENTSTENATNTTNGTDNTGAELQGPPP